MLTLYQIIETECCFLAIDQKHLPYDICYEVVGVFLQKKYCTIFLFIMADK